MSIINIYSAEPPTREELIQNLTIIEMKKSNAAKIDKKFAKVIDASATKAPESDKLVTGMAFPSYKDYERVPGKKEPEWISRNKFVKTVFVDTYSIK